MDRAARRRAARAEKNTRQIAGVWLSNAPFAQTGYGTQTKQAVTRMARDGHQMVVACNYGLEATQTTFDGIELWPKGFDPYSNDIVGPYFKDWSNQHPDLVPILFTLYDVWVFKGDLWDEMPVVPWVPVDHLPAPPDVVKFCAKPNVTPVAMSDFGRAQLERAGVESRFIPHGIETSIYKPTDAFDGHTGRGIMGVPDDAYVVSIVNANKGTVPTRKAWAENILAFSIFAQSHPDAVLYLHTERFGAMGGIPLDPILKACGLEVGKNVFFINQYALRQGIPDEAMAAVYSASDLLLAATLGEGYGLTVAEAQATGTLVVANNFSAQPELVGDGFLTDSQPWWDPAQGAWFSTPLVPSIVDCLEQAYRRGHERSQKARAHIVDHFDADLVFDTGWRPLLTELGCR